MILRGLFRQSLSAKKGVVSVLKALVINCSPVRTGATAKIVRIITEKLSEKYTAKSK